MLFQGMRLERAIAEKIVSPGENAAYPPKSDASEEFGDFLAMHGN